MANEGAVKTDRRELRRVGLRARGHPVPIPQASKRERERVRSTKGDGSCANPVVWDHGGGFGMLVHYRTVGAVHALSLGCVEEDRQTRRCNEQMKSRATDSAAKSWRRRRQGERSRCRHTTSRPQRQAERTHR